ncbi:kynureninase [[Candida] railenensis]|uniref:Kynureninase n=1 Tax=[Candida] railenensis TaxID=45579 RepID=A0A9P0QLI3_9ASCO|nr:kynureninase [[Candida] railenensis]
MSYSELDSKYPVDKDLFVFPTLGSLGIESDNPGSSSVYLCGNSLGLMPKSTPKAINDELKAWGERAVEAHFRHPGADDGLTSWMDIDLPVLPLLAPIVGAKETEVALSGSLTANLNSLLISFYKPKGSKTKILFEKHAFPSDYYAFLNLVKLFGYDESHLIQLEVPEGETYLKTEYILKTIASRAEEIAIICLPGIQYYTGQFFDIETITKFAQNHNIVVGWDLAHAVGNVSLKLHDWGVDFAAWCSYKYLNSGPGAIAGLFVHEKYTKNNSKDSFPPRLAGWWGNNASVRFKMLEEFDPIQSALSYRQSNPSVIDVVSVKASLEIFSEAGGIDTLRERSLKLTQYLQDLLTQSKYYLKDSQDNRLGFQILTPLNPQERGAQLSLLFKPHYDDPKKNVMELVIEYLRVQGVICDERRPDVIRVAPAPLYNSFEDVFKAVSKIIECLEVIESSK